MRTMNISLPDPMKQYVEEQVAAGAYSSASEYIRELVRADQKRQAKEQLEQVLLSALDSGDPVEATPEWWASLQQEMRTRSKAREASRKTAATATRAS
jgi:antitoxin ParD1/3/4